MKQKTITITTDKLSKEPHAVAHDYFSPKSHQLHVPKSHQHVLLQCVYTGMVAMSHVM